jgi:hypothetical protein
MHRTNIPAIEIHTQAHGKAKEVGDWAGEVRTGTSGMRIVAFTKKHNILQQ